MSRTHAQRRKSRRSASEAAKSSRSRDKRGLRGADHATGQKMLEPGGNSYERQRSRLAPESGKPARVRDMRETDSGMRVTVNRGANHGITTDTEFSWRGDVCTIFKIGGRNSEIIIPASGDQVKAHPEVRYNGGKARRERVTCYHSETLEEGAHEVSFGAPKWTKVGMRVKDSRSGAIIVVTEAFEGGSVSARGIAYGPRAPRAYRSMKLTPTSQAPRFVAGVPSIVPTSFDGQRSRFNVTVGREILMSGRWGVSIGDLRGEITSLGDGVCEVNVDGNTDVLNKELEDAGNEVVFTFRG